MARGNADKKYRALMITLACALLAASLRAAPETDLRPAPPSRKNEIRTDPGISPEVRSNSCPVRRLPTRRSAIRGQPEVAFRGLIDHAVGRRAIRATEFENGGV
jgi:hypothetical protein